MIHNLQPGIPFTLEAKTFVKVQFYLEEDSTLMWDVRAGSPVDVYLVDQEQFERFINGDNWRYEEGESQSIRYTKTVELPFSDNWTILIDNRSDDNIPTYFDIRVWPK